MEATPASDSHWCLPEDWDSSVVDALCGPSDGYTEKLSHLSIGRILARSPARLPISLHRPYRCPFRKSPTSNRAIFSAQYSPYSAEFTEDASAADRENSRLG